MKKIRIGIAGLGRLGRSHALNLAFKIPNAKLVAACSVVPAELDFAKNELEVEELYDDFAKMCASPNLDAVAIVTPSVYHPEQVECALKAGKHIFCEKPLAVTVDDCKKIEKMAEAYPDLVFALGFMRRFDPSYAYAKKKIEEGAIGKPYMVKATGVDPDADAESLLDSGYVPKSGGIFIDMASHDIDLMRWFLEDDPDSVYSVGTTVKHSRFTEQGDFETAAAIFTFKNGGIGQLHVGRASVHGYHIETEIIGTEGSIRVSPVPAKNLALLYDKTGAVQECVRNFPERFNESYAIELEAFCNAVLEGKKPLVNVYDGTKATQIGYACKESLDSGKLVKIEY
ncbi:MAG: Gfo/Idh/MocA family oxidoreductase [Lachnospiraceae bacterium]|jgi:myo-inositol 2-dehydrogenase/D-chiro-inositol 1-dehydrogenase|nr:Gfo/Idh/MocA family oxidoreductase [Lachnospiraceae bacterium]